MCLRFVRLGRRGSFSMGMEMGRESLVWYGAVDVEY